MTLKLIQLKARDLQGKTRRKLAGSLAGPFATVSFYVLGAKALAPLEPQLNALFAAALVWSVAGLYFLNRGLWSAAMPSDAGLSTGVEFCKAEVGRRVLFLSRSLVWSLAPILLSISTLILGLAMRSTARKGLFPNAMPFLALVAVWILASLVLRVREKRQLQREIAELDELATTL